jgi:hypothetical protein
MRVVQPLSTAALITSLFLVHTHTSLVRVSGDPSLPLATRSGEALVLRFNSNDGPLLILLFTLVLTLGRPARPAKEREGNFFLKIFIMLPAPTYLHCKKQTNKKTEGKFIATAVRTSSGVGEFLSLQAP